MTQFPSPPPGPTTSALPTPQAPKKSKRGGINIAIVISMCALVVVPLGLLVAVLVPAVGGSREMANRASCEMNLLQIGKGAAMYVASHKQKWPKIPCEKGSSWAEIGDTRKDQVAGGQKPPEGVPAADKGDYEPRYETSAEGINVVVPTVQPKSNTANLWQLVSGGYVTTAMVICPSADAQRDDTVKIFWKVRGFRGPGYVSYSLQNCWGEYCLAAASSRNANSFAVMADVNPQRKDFTREGGATAQHLAGKPRFVHDAWSKMTVSGAHELNSPNHKFAGQNVLYLDGHVDWTDNPWCGAKGDNIWVMRKAKGGTPIGDAATATLEALRSWDDGASYDGKKTLPADSVDDSFLVP